MSARFPTQLVVYLLTNVHWKLMTANSGKLAVTAWVLRWFSCSCWAQSNHCTTTDARACLWTLNETHAAISHWHHKRNDFRFIIHLCSDLKVLPFGQVRYTLCFVVHRDAVSIFIFPLALRLPLTPPLLFFGLLLISTLLISSFHRHWPLNTYKFVQLGELL